MIKPFLKKIFLILLAGDVILGLGYLTFLPKFGEDSKQYLGYVLVLMIGNLVMELILILITSRNTSAVNKLYSHQNNPDTPSNRRMNNLTNARVDRLIFSWSGLVIMYLIVTIVVYTQGIKDIMEILRLLLVILGVGLNGYSWWLTTRSVKKIIAELG